MTHKNAQDVRREACAETVLVWLLRPWSPHRPNVSRLVHHYAGSLARGTQLQEMVCPWNTKNLEKKNTKAKMTVKTQHFQNLNSHNAVFYKGLREANAASTVFSQSYVVFVCFCISQQPNIQHKSENSTKVCVKTLLFACTSLKCL